MRKKELEKEVRYLKDHHEALAKYFWKLNDEVRRQKKPQIPDTQAEWDAINHGGSQ